MKPGEALRIWRKRRGLTLFALAWVLGKQVRTEDLYRWECGMEPIPPEFITPLAKALRCREEEFRCPDDPT